MDWRSRLDLITRDCMEPDWNSYGAVPVTQAAIRAARLLCESLDVVPCNDGGVQIDLAAEAITIELDKDGRIATVYISNQDVDQYVHGDA